MAAKVVYTVQVPGIDETQQLVEGAFVLPSGAPQLTLAELREVWPFAGAFCFRAKLIVPDDEGGYMWLDLVDEHDTVPLQDGVATVRALPLFDVASASVDESLSHTEDFNLSPLEYDQWRAARAEQLRLPLPERSPRGSPTSSARPRSDSRQASPEAAASGFESSPGVSTRSAAASATDEWASDDWGTPAAQASQARRAPSPSPRGSEGWEDEDHTPESSAATWERERQRHSAVGGSAIFKGLVSGVAKAATDVKKAADKAAKNVEKKGWFKSLKSAAANAAAAVSAGLSDDVINGGERRERRNTGANLPSQGEPLGDEDEEGAAQEYYGEESPAPSPAQRAKGPTSKNASPAEAGGSGSSGALDLEWRTD